MNDPLTLIPEVTHRVWPLVGGVHPEENKHQSTGRPIARPPLPSRFVVSLSQHDGSASEPSVAVGDKVLKGQMIARATGLISLPLHAPTSGEVVAIDPQVVPHPSGMKDNCITIIPDGDDRWCELHPIADYRSEQPAKLVEHLRQAGVAGLGGAVFPTAVKLTPGKSIHTIILNGAECEPYITADDMLMREKADDMIAGIDIVMHLVSAERCLIGIEDNKPEAIAAVKKVVAGRHNMTVRPFPTKYPSGGSSQMVQILTGQEIPSGGLSSDLGMMVVNVGTAVAVYDAIQFGKPMISRITTLTGEALSSPQNVETLIGTPMAELLEFAGLHRDKLSTLVMGGPMMGVTLSTINVPVVKATNCLIAATAEEFPPAPPAQACIRCGLCAEACPASLLPQQLYWHSRAENFEQLKHHNLFDCIECGACSFICPSHIPLVQYYRASKGEIRNQRLQLAKTERSKIRYENRQARLVREEAEKEARRKANAERAAKLKAAQAETAQQADAPGTKSLDPVQAAIARAKAKKAAGGSVKAGKTGLTPQQKGLKIKLSLANAQLKKTQRVLAQAEKSDMPNDVITKLTSDIAMLQHQAEQLQKEYDAAGATPANSPDDAPQPHTSQTNTSEVTDTADVLKKMKIESAMVQAALKKAERALARAMAEDNAETEALKESVEACRIKANQLSKELKKASARDAPKQPATAAAEPGADAKKLKVQHAMAKAALKKAQRAVDSVKESGEGDMAQLELALSKATSNLEQAEKALAALG